MCFVPSRRFVYNLPLTMAAESDTDDLTEEEEVEEKEIFLELDSNQEYGDNPHVEFLGLDQEKPLMNLNGITYKGTWEEALGTVLFLEETNELESYHPLLKNDLNYVLDVKYKTKKILKMSRCVIVKNRETVEDIRTVIKRTAAEAGENGQYSSEEENLDEYYSATIEPENVKNLTEPLMKSEQPSTSGDGDIEDEALGEVGDIYEDDALESCNESKDITELVEEKVDVSLQSEAFDPTSNAITSDALLDQSQAVLSGLEDESYLYDYQTDSSTAGQSPGPSTKAGGSQITQQMSALQVKTELFHDAEPGCSKFT